MFGGVGSGSDCAVGGSPPTPLPHTARDLRDQRRNSFQFNDRLIPIKQLDTQRRNRREFVTYWILVGDQLAKSNTDGKLIKLKYGFKGVIPDGLLFRVSSVGMNANQHYTMQQSFLEELLRAIDTKDLPKVIGVK